MTEAQIQLQKALTTTFLANLAFLSEYDNDLYHRVDELSRMIEDGGYEEKYALEFIMGNGEFDIYDIVNDKYLYDRTPKKRNDDLVKKIYFDKKESIFNVESYFSSKSEVNIEKKNKFEYETDTEFTALTLNEMFEYSNTLKDFLEEKKKRFKRINKFIFIGTLLGRHIPRIANKVDADIYLVLERNLEIFRLSLFTVDYTILGNKGVIFSIMDEYLEEIKKISKFIDISHLDNYILKFSTSNINVDKYIDNILAYLISNKPTMYDYNRYLYIKVDRTTKMLKSEYRTLLFNEINKNCNLFESVPILYLAAGPSLEENMQWIIDNQNKFFIVTIGAAYKKLLSNNIKVDIITSLDEDLVLNHLQFDQESIAKIDKETIIIANCATNYKIISKLKDFNLFLYETQIPIHKNNIALSGYSIGEVTLDILLKMNAKEIYLIGLDLALNQDTGLSHSKGSNSDLKIYDLDEEYNREHFSLSQGIIKVKGNLKEQVNTTSAFNNSIQSANLKLEQKAEDCNIYNLSSHGAYFENTIPINIDDIMINNFKNINISVSKITDFLESNSLKKLSLSSRKEVIREIEFLESILKKELLQINDTIYTNYEEFKNDFLKVILFIRKDKNSFIYQIINDYSKIIFPYFNFHFNDIKIKNEGKKVNKVKNILIKQVEKLIRDYINCLKRLKI